MISDAEEHWTDADGLLQDSRCVNQTDIDPNWTHKESVLQLVEKTKNTNA